MLIWIQHQFVSIFNIKQITSLFQWFQIFFCEFWVLQIRWQSYHFTFVPLIDKDEMTSSASIESKTAFFYLCKVFKQFNLKFSWEIYLVVWVFLLFLPLFDFWIASSSMIHLYCNLELSFYKLQIPCLIKYLMPLGSVVLSSCSNLKIELSLAVNYIFVRKILHVC